MADTKKAKMKTASDPRHRKREKAVKCLFRLSFQEKQTINNQLAEAVLQKTAKIDKSITQAALEWPIEQINKIDLAILRLAIYELIIKPKEPPKVIIDEAIELAKAYGSEKSSAFVNGVLGTVLKNYQQKNEKSAKISQKAKN